jgi:hypothetical protein
LTEDESSRFYQLASQQPAMKLMRFVALVNDFANIARGEATSDMLLAYEM